MRPNLSLVFVVIAFLSIDSCKNHAVEPQSSPDPALSVVGIPGRTKTFSYTIANYIQGTNQPFILPPDSLKSTLQFPESLYTSGIFNYGTIVEKCMYSLDTLVVTQTESGYNLYSIIFNWCRHVSTNGASVGLAVNKYIQADQNKIYQVSGSYREIVYQLPLTVGAVYQSLVTTAVFTVVSQDTITTIAGTFATFRIDVNGRWRPDYSETHYVSPSFGIIRSELRYPSANESVPWDTSYVRSVVQIQKYELISIK